MANMTQLDLIVDRTRKFYASIAYCDKIAHLTREALMDSPEFQDHFEIGHICLDLHEDGSFRSTKKTISVTDRHSKKKYTLIIEEA